MSEVALSATALDKHFGGLRAVSGVSVDVHVGEVHAVIGPNGAGKSTLINLLSGELFANAGRIMLGDADITFPVASDAASIHDILTELDTTRVPERAGRALDHETEDAFERLRVAGYL